VRPNLNSVEVHPQPSNIEHPVDGALVGAGSPKACHLRQASPADKVGT